MYRQVLMGVHKTRYDKSLEFIKEKGGILSTIQPEQDKDSDFVLIEVNFEDLNKMNDFIYGMYMRNGVYAYVDTIVIKTNIF